MFILAYSVNHKILKLRRYKRLTNAVKACHRLIQVDNVTSLSLGKIKGNDLDYAVLEINKRG